MFTLVFPLPLSISAHSFYWENAVSKYHFGASPLCLLGATSNSDKTVAFLSISFIQNAADWHDDNVSIHNDDDHLGRQLE
jgi:hypothetical protein